MCDECGLPVAPEQVAVVVGWIETERGKEPDWAFVGHVVCAEFVAAHLAEVHGRPTVIDDGSWLRKAAGQ